MAKRYKFMIIQCRKCRDIIVIGPTDWYKLGDYDCKFCWEENYENLMIIGWTNNKSLVLDLDEEIKIQKYCRKNVIDRDDYILNSNS